MRRLSIFIMSMMMSIILSGIPVFAEQAGRYQLVAHPIEGLFKIDTHTGKTYRFVTPKEVIEESKLLEEVLLKTNDEKAQKKVEEEMIKLWGSFTTGYFKPIPTRE